MQFTKDMTSNKPHYPVAMLLGILLICISVFFLTACSHSGNENESESGMISSADKDASGSAAHSSVVYLDAGHGGDNAGARAGDVYEKDINLQIVQKVKALLESDGYQVFTTRDSDTSVSLEDRTRMAEEGNADIFVSIHQNSLDNDTSTSGIKTHCSSQANAKNSNLASLMQKTVVAATGARDRGTEEDSSQYVLQSTRFPSCLIETGFLTSTSEGSMLQDSAYQDKIADGIAKAIKEFLSSDSSDESSEESSSVPSESSSSESSQESSSDESESPSGEPESSSDGSSESTPESGPKTTSGEPSPDEKVVYITIDDGPTTGTPKLLNILDQYDAKATWFVTAQFMEGSALEDMIKQIHDSGHAVGVHTFSHQYKKIYQSVDAYMEDYNKMNKIIESATGESSNLFRFPGGSNAGYNKKIRRQLLDHVKEEGLVYYDWNAFTGDTDGLSRSEMISKAVKECSYNNKAILLMHDVPRKDTVIDALPDILQALKDKGYEFRALDTDVVPIQFEK